MKKVFKKHKRLVIILLLFISVGFAYLSTQLDILGNTLLKANTWDVHFENVQVSEGSVTSTDPVIDANRTSVTFSASLDKPGDFYEFTVDAVNDGTIDAMINTITDFNLTESQKKYLETSVVYTDGEILREKQELLAQDFDTFKVKVSYKKDLSAEDLPENVEELNMTFSLEYVQRDNTALTRKTNGYLYNVIKKTSETTNFAKLYTGEHNDSIDSNKSLYDVYHYYAPSSDDGLTIHNMNNVLFANHCWEMYRTTDTGGVKLIYNGEPQDYKCPDDRPNHFGYTGSTLYLNNYNYYYATDYIYNEDSHTYSLAGDLIQSPWNASTYSDLVGKYTCRSTSASSTCSSLYYIDSYKNSYNANVISVNNDIHYAAIGKSRFNSSGDSPAYNGYMYDENYAYKFGSTWFSGYYVVLWDTSVYNNSYYDFNNYYFSDSIDYDPDTSKYTLVNPTKYDRSNPSDFVGKYTFRSNDSSYSSTYINYISHIDGNKAYYSTFKNGNSVDSGYVSFYYGDSYISNGDNTYTIVDGTLISEMDWASNYENISAKYICVKTGDNICNSVYSLTETTVSDFYYTCMDEVSKFSDDFIYQNGVFKLSGNIIDYSHLKKTTAELEDINKAHYTCLNSSGECDKIFYIFATGSGTIYSSDHDRKYSLRYLIINNNNKYDEALYKMLSSNTTSSEIKKIIDKWYENNMLDYSSYLDDTVFCNDRSYISNDTNIHFGNNLFLKYKSSKSVENSDRGDIYCENVEDRFSISNNKAKLQYPVGLITRFEYTIMNHAAIVKGTSNYWSMSPYYYDGEAFHVFLPDHNWIIGSGYLPTGYATDDSNYIRPVISLKKDVQYVDGDGSLNNPYYIGDINNVSIDNNLFTVKDKMAPGKTVVIYSDKYAVTSFKYNGIYVEGESFVMPNEDVSITDIEYIKANYSIYNSDDTIEVPTYGRYRSSIYLSCADDYMVSSFKLNGELINGNSFIMPAENVTITDVVKTPIVVVESAHSPYANNISNVVYYENTFEGATAINVELTYQTESTSYDWIYLYTNANSSTPYNNKKYGGTTLKTENLTINSNYLKIVFRTDSSGNNYYGFKAVIKPVYY